MENGKIPLMFAQLVPIRTLKAQFAYHVQLVAHFAMDLTSASLVRGIIHLWKAIILDTACLTVREVGIINICTLMIRVSAKEQTYQLDLRLLLRHK